MTMTNDKTVTMSRELAERIVKTCAFTLPELDYQELRALLAAPVVERQEPVGWQRKSRHEDGRWFYLPDDDVEEAIRLGYEVRKLYTSPPAPVAVVLPERKVVEKALEAGDVPAEYEARGYNQALDDVQACLEKVKGPIHVGELDPAQRLALARGEL